jgi:hypothetical protein
MKSCYVGRELNQINNEKFTIFTKVNVFLKMAVFWVVAQYSLIEVYQHLGGSCCLHFQGDDGGSKNL